MGIVQQDEGLSVQERAGLLGDRQNPLEIPQTRVHPSVLEKGADLPLQMLGPAEEVLFFLEEKDGFRGGEDDSFSRFLLQEGDQKAQVLYSNRLVPDETVLNGVIGLDSRFQRAVIKDGRGDLSVSPGPPGFLHVGFEVGWRRAVDDQANIRLVYPHPEALGRDHDRGLAPEEILLLLFPSPFTPALRHLRMVPGNSLSQALLEKGSEIADVRTQRWILRFLGGRGKGQKD